MSFESGVWVDDEQRARSEKEDVEVRRGRQAAAADGAGSMELGSS
jgi:hypothetical protein